MDWGFRESSFRIPWFGVFVGSVFGSRDLGFSWGQFSVLVIWGFRGSSFRFSWFRVFVIWGFELSWFRVFGLG